MRKTSYLPAGVERENFKIDCCSLFGVGPADIMHVEQNVRLRHVCIRLTYNSVEIQVWVSLSVGWLARIAQTH